MSDSLRPHEAQHARPPCPSPTPGVYSDSCPRSRWCHPDISSSVVAFSSCPQSLPASGAFPMSQLFLWGGQSIGVSALAISPSKEHPGLISSRMDWFDPLVIQGTLKSLLQHHSSHMCTPIKSALQLRSCYFVIPSPYNFSQLFPGNHWCVYSPFWLICIYYIFMLIESHTMYSFLSGFLYSAQLFWNSLVLFISTVYHFLLLSAEY